MIAGMEVCKMEVPIYAPRSGMCRFYLQPGMVVADGVKIAEMLRGPSGPVFRHLIDRAQLVQTAAKTQIKDKAYDTGCLYGSVVKRFEKTDMGDIAVRLVSDTTPCNPRRASYSAYIHDGTPPHDIPRAFGYPLPFGIGGRFGGKFHPGITHPVHFFTDNLHLAVD